MPRIPVEGIVEAAEGVIKIYEYCYSVLEYVIVIVR